MHDTVIVGAGPAGMTAALYLLRLGRRVLLLESDSFGGQIASSPRVANYPGIPSIAGLDFADALLSQVTELGAEIDVTRVTGLRKSSDGFEVICENGAFPCKTVILATGVRHRTLGLPEEDRYIGRGISFCAICDGPFYKGKAAAVVGGGNSALQEALCLSEICASVQLIHRRAAFRGEARLLAELRQKPNVRLLTNTVITAFSGEGRLTALTLQNVLTGDVSEIAADVLFEAIGLIPGSESFRDLVQMDENGYLSAGEDCRTSCPGIFAAGDCRTKTVRQLTTAVADGSAAALAAAAYLEGN